MACEAFSQVPSGDLCRLHGMSMRPAALWHLAFSAAWAPCLTFVDIFLKNGYTEQDKQTLLTHVNYKVTTAIYTNTPRLRDSERILPVSHLGKPDFGVRTFTPCAGHLQENHRPQRPELIPRAVLPLAPNCVAGPDLR